MRYLARRNLPTLSQALADLGNPSPREISNYLEVTERTVYRWVAAGVAPRPVELALFWETSYGESLIDCDLVNRSRVMHNLSESLGLEVKKLQARVAWLEAHGRFGSANAPWLSAVPGAAHVFPATGPHLHQRGGDQRAPDQDDGFAPQLGQRWN